MLTETLKLQATEQLFFFPKKLDCTRLSTDPFWVTFSNQINAWHDGSEPDIFQVKSSTSSMCSRGGWRPWKPTQPTAHITAPRSRVARRKRRKRTWFPLHTWKLHYRWLQSWKCVRSGSGSLFTHLLSLLQTVDASQKKLEEEVTAFLSILKSDGLEESKVFQILWCCLVSNMCLCFFFILLKWIWLKWDVKLHQCL